jgi:hypothetical protein
MEKISMKNISYSNDNGDDRCPHCKGATFLLCTHDFWAIDKEPIKNGESIEDIKNNDLKQAAENIYENGIELGTEISCHYCPNCETIISICVNWD